MNSNWIIEEKDFGVVLTPQQEWDLDMVNEFSAFIEKNLKPEKDQNFIVDLHKIEYIDSMALGVLINLHRRYKEEGGTVFLLKPHATVDKILKESGVFKIFEIFYSDNEMMDRLKA